MDHAHPHLTNEDRERLQLGGEVLLARMRAWQQETPGACSCDQIEILSRCLAIAMFSAGRDLPAKVFNAASAATLRGTKAFLAELRRDRRLIDTICRDLFGDAP
jgi:hypothetical protein